MTVTRHLGRAATALVAIAALSAAWLVFGLWRAWGSVERVPFETASAREALATRIEPDPEPLPSEGAASGSATDREIAQIDLQDAGRTFLVIGSDADEGIAGQRADVIILGVLPDGDEPALLVSLPRDLYLPNPCTGGPSRINANLNGCGEAATGSELLAIAVEDFTGVSVDHFVAFEFEGFVAVVDRLGGIEVCLDHAVRDGAGAAMLLPAGCTRADGEQMLAWVRSRHTQELVDGEWRTVPGVNDLHRNRRQRALLVDILGEVGRFRSITELTGLAEDLAGAFTLDRDLSLSNAIALAWNLRDLDGSAILQPEIPVRDHVTPGGAMVLIPEASFAEVLVAAGAGGLLQR